LIWRSSAISVSALKQPHSAIRKSNSALQPSSHPEMDYRQRLARDLCLTGRVIDAREAYRIGLVNEVVDADRLLNRAVESVCRCWRLRWTPCGRQRNSFSIRPILASRNPFLLSMTRPFRNSPQKSRSTPEIKTLSQTGEGFYSWFDSAPATKTWRSVLQEGHSGNNRCFHIPW